MNQQLQVIEYSDQRILTTQQIATAYETTERRISENFNRNKDRYTEGKHYFFLEGETLKTFKDSLQTTPKIAYQSGSTTTQFAYQSEENSLFGDRATSLYLWTEKGAFMHAKSINTDPAWQVYEMLVDEYYRMRINPLQGAFDVRELFAQSPLEFNQSIRRMRRIRRLDAPSKQPRQLSAPRTSQFSDLSPRENVLRVIRHIIEIGEGAPTLRDLRRYLPRMATETLKTAVTDLVREGLIVEEKTAHAVKYSLA